MWLDVGMGSHNRKPEPKIEPNQFGLAFGFNLLRLKLRETLNLWVPRTLFIAFYVLNQEIT